MGRSCEKEVLRRGPWTDEEDQKLIAYIQQHGHGSWSALPEKAGLKRCGKSCRLRWINYLRPDIKRGKFSLQEEQTIIQLHAFLGNRWSAIAAHLPKRTDNEIKNHWNTYLKKRLIKMGIDPTTHKPRIDTLGSSSGQGSNDAANLSHMAQWERARLEAEARSAQDSNNKQALLPNHVQPKTQLGCGSSAVPLIPLASRPKCLDILKAWQGMVTDMFNFPSHDNLDSPSSISNFSNAEQCQVPTAGINQNAISEGVEVEPSVATNLYTCNELLDDLHNWKRVDKFNHQVQELENVMDESSSMAMQGTSMYSIESAWLLDSTNYREGNYHNNLDLIANFMEGSSEILAGVPVSFSSIEVDGNMFIGSCNVNSGTDHTEATTGIATSSSWFPVKLGTKNSLGKFN